MMTEKEQMLDLVLELVVQLLMVSEMEWVAIHMMQLLWAFVSKSEDHIHRHHNDFGRHLRQCF
jgi:hypothetical protein